MSVGEDVAGVTFERVAGSRPALDRITAACAGVPDATNSWESNPIITQTYILRKNNVPQRFCLRTMNARPPIKQSYGLEFIIAQP